VHGQRHQPVVCRVPCAACAVVAHAQPPACAAMMLEDTLAGASGDMMGMAAEDGAGQGDPAGAARPPRWYGCLPDPGFDAPIPVERLRGNAAAQTCWVGCGRYRRALRWLGLLLLCAVVIYGPLNSSIPDPQRKREVELPTGALLAEGSCHHADPNATGGNSSGGGDLSCRALQVNVWQQFTGLVLQDVAGVQAAQQQHPPCPAQAGAGSGSAGATATAATAGAATGQPTGFQCHSCVCRRLRRFIRDFANASLLGSACRLPEVLEAVQAHQSWLGVVRVRVRGQDDDDARLARRLAALLRLLLLLLLPPRAACAVGK
jgi:hypothetical protein